MHTSPRAEHERVMAPSLYRDASSLRTHTYNVCAGKSLSRWLEERCMLGRVAGAARAARMPLMHCLSLASKPQDKYRHDRHLGRQGNVVARTPAEAVSIS